MKNLKMTKEDILSAAYLSGFEYEEDNSGNENSKALEILTNTSIRL